MHVMSAGGTSEDKGSEKLQSSGWTYPLSSAKLPTSRGRGIQMPGMRTGHVVSRGHAWMQMAKTKVRKKAL